MTRRALLIVSAALTLCVAFARPTMATDATVNAIANVVKAISISKDTGMDLKFGVLRPSTTGSATITISTSGTRSNPDGLTVGSSDAYQAARFTVTGERSTAFSVTIPTSLSISDGNSHTLTVSSFTSDPASSSTLSTSGTKTINVGATVTIAQNCTPGTYSGVFSVTVDYQ